MKLVKYPDESMRFEAYFTVYRLYAPFNLGTLCLLIKFACHQGKFEYVMGHGAYHWHARLTFALLHTPYISRIHISQQPKA